MRLFGLMVFILIAAPKLRIMIGPAPLYTNDLLIALLLLFANRASIIRQSSLRPFSSLIVLYLALVWFGELRGMITYGTLLKSIYMIGEYSLAIFLFFIIPRLVRTADDIAIVLKALVAGMLCTSAITILYSLPPTRPLVMNTILSYKFLVPSAETLARKMLAAGGVQAAMRGYSLVGPSTMTTGLLGTVWAFAFLAAKWPGISRKWHRLANVASIITPVAILMTYGRAAWFTFIVIGSMAFFFGFARGRRNVALLLVGLAFIVYQVGWQSEWFLINRVVKTTRHTIENPYEDQSTDTRLESFIEPFSHLSQNPSWLIAGTGVVGQKRALPESPMAELYEAADLSKHSGFGMAYYCYGLIAALIHALIMFNGFLFISRRLRTHQTKVMPLYKISWQAFFMAWCGLLFWWLPGHAVISKPHGVILFFFFFGFMMACDRVLRKNINGMVRR